MRHKTDDNQAEGHINDQQSWMNSGLVDCCSPHWGKTPFDVSQKSIVESAH